MSPLALAFVWVGLCPFGRATFIGWRPLEPPHWSLGVVRWHGGALLVLLFLLFDLLNDLPDLPLCSLLERQHTQDEVLTYTWLFGWTDCKSVFVFSFFCSFSSQAWKSFLLLCCVHVHYVNNMGAKITFIKMLSLRAFKQHIDSCFQYLSDKEEQRKQYNDYIIHLVKVLPYHQLNVYFCLPCFSIIWHQLSELLFWLLAFTWTFFQ